MNETEFEKELTALLNSHSMENSSDTPDFLLAHFMIASLQAYNETTNLRDKWRGHKHWEFRDDSGVANISGEPTNVDEHS